MSKWTSSAGPRQTKAVSEAINKLNWRGKTQLHITDHGQHESTPFCGAVSEDCQTAMQQIGERFAWTVTRENYREVVAAFEAATKSLVLPVVDNRSTPEERAERERIRMENERQDAERKAAVESSKSSLSPKVPAWADALIVAELDEDDSDLMTDYHNHKTTRHVLIGFRKGKREDFRQLRAAAAQFPETAHLGPGKDDWTVMIYAEEDKGQNVYRRREIWRDDSYQARHFHTEAEAKEAIEAAIVVARQKAAEEMARSGSRVVELDECLYGYDLCCESVEHRENWSMGGGNYLKASGRHSSGWKVRSRDLSELNRGAFEDGLPAAAPTAEQSASAAPVAGQGYQIEQHKHTKKGFDMSIVVLNDRVDRNRFEALRASCEGAGGWYSRQWGKTPGGFAFKQRESAEQWAASVFGGATAPAAAPEAAPAAEASPPTVPLTQGIAARLRTLAEGMAPEIENKRRPMTQSLTPKRQREYASRVIDGNNLERGQKALLSLADAWDLGDVPAVLQGLRTKSQVLPLVRIRTGSNGYYDVHETGEYSDQSEAGKALRALVEASESPEAKAAAAERERKQAIERMEHALVGLDIPGFFPTPRQVIEEMLDLADIRHGHRVLEPSAGKGDILDAIAERADEGGLELDLVAVEVNYRLGDILKAKGYKLADERDFLEFSEGGFDRIVMNPPFMKGADVDHVRHAYELLAPGGRVVAITSAGPFYRSDKKSQEFRTWLDEMGVYPQDLPSGTFNGKDSFRQTGVASKLIVIAKPSESLASEYAADGDEAPAAGVEV